MHGTRSLEAKCESGFGINLPNLVHLKKIVNGVVSQLDRRFSIAMFPATVAGQFAIFNSNS